MGPPRGPRGPQKCFPEAPETPPKRSREASRRSLLSTTLSGPTTATRSHREAPSCCSSSSSSSSASPTPLLPRLLLLPLTIIPLFPIIIPLFCRAVTQNNLVRRRQLRDGTNSNGDSSDGGNGRLVPCRSKGKRRGRDIEDRKNRGGEKKVGAKQNSICVGVLLLYSVRNSI